MLTIECIDQPDRFYLLQKPWNALLDRHAGADLLLTHPWFTMSWEGYCRGSRLQILVVKEGQTVVGIAPLIIQTVKRKGIPIRKVTFLHEGSSYYRGDFLIPERTEEILERLFFYLSRKRGWEMATFAGIPEDSRTAAILERVARRCGLSTGSWHPFGRALFLPIQGAWDDYLTRQGRHFRKHVWERERKLNALGKVESLTFRDPGSVKKAIEQLYDIQMKNRKAEGLEIPESDLSSRSAALRLAGLFSNEGMAEVKILTLDEKPVAGLFSIVYKGCSYAIIIKYDKEYASVSPGMTVLYHYVRDAWAQKADRIDFLMDWPYVERWTDQAKQYLKIDCFHPGPLSQGIRYSKRVDTWLRRGRSS